MPLDDMDLARRRSSVGLSPDQVDFTLYSYNKHSFNEQHFTCVHDLLAIFENEHDDGPGNSEEDNSTNHWIEVINNSSARLPRSIELLCEYFELHQLTVEDIYTLTTGMKLDLFNGDGGIYLLMKTILWNQTHIEQQQISFYLRCSQHVLITFQEKSTTDDLFFEAIRCRLRRQQPDSDNLNYGHHNRLRELYVDYLFFCLLDAIIDRY